MKLDFLVVDISRCCWLVGLSPFAWASSLSDFPPRRPPPSAAGTQPQRRPAPLPTFIDAAQPDHAGHAAQPNHAERHADAGHQLPQRPGKHRQADKRHQLRHTRLVEQPAAPQHWRGREHQEGDPCAADLPGGGGHAQPGGAAGAERGSDDCGGSAARGPAVWCAGRARGQRRGQPRPRAPAKVHRALVGPRRGEHGGRPEEGFLWCQSQLHQVSPAAGRLRWVRFNVLLIVYVIYLSKICLLHYISYWLCRFSTLTSPPVTPVMHILFLIRISCDTINLCICHS